MTVKELIGILEKVPKRKKIVVETPLGLTFNIQYVAKTDDEVIIVSTANGDE